MEEAHRCKYCGGLTGHNKDICGHCSEKLKLIRKIKALLAPCVEAREKRRKECDKWQM